MTAWPFGILSWKLFRTWVLDGVKVSFTRWFPRFRNFSCLTVAPFSCFLVEARSRVDISRTGECCSVQNLFRLTNAIHRIPRTPCRYNICHWVCPFTWWRPVISDSFWIDCIVDQSKVPPSGLARHLKKPIEKGGIGRQVDGYIPPFHDTQRRNLSVSLNFDAFSWSTVLGGRCFLYFKNASRTHYLRHIPFS